MKYKKTFVGSILLLSFLYFLNSCGIYRPVSAKDYPPEPEKRVAKNIEEGRGFRLMGGDKNRGTFDFASSNELWRASLDTIDFMPLLSVNYSGGIIVTDWYSDEQSASGESVKISIRFLTNEIRSDALDIKVFYKKCSSNENCKIIEKSKNIKKELSKKILTKAAVYEAETKVKNYRPYKGKVTTRDGGDEE